MKNVRLQILKSRIVVDRGLKPYRTAYRIVVLLWIVPSWHFKIFFLLLPPNSNK